MKKNPPFNIEPLCSILKLEINRMYSDTAVIGGLDKYILKWSAETRNKVNGFPELISAINKLHLFNPGYATLNEKQREIWLRQVINWLDSIKVNASFNSNNGKVSFPKEMSIKEKHSEISTFDIDNLSISKLSGIKTNISGKFERLGVQTVRDLLYLFPRYHLDYSQQKKIEQLIEGEDQTVLAIIWESRIVRLGSQKGTELTIGDDTGNMKVIWFNQPYLAKTFSTNARIVISGKCSIYRGQKIFYSPEWEIVTEKELVHTGRMVPVYPLTKGLYQRQIRNLISKTVNKYIVNMVDFMPEETRKRCNLLDLQTAIKQAHFPDNNELKIKARTRLAFDELFLIQIGVLNKKRKWQEDQPGKRFLINAKSTTGIIDNLSFKLTGAQQVVLEEIFADLEQARPMSRLLQGDVGSGKTIVAIIALLACIENNYQGVLMAPTEILADQHFHNICKLFSFLGTIKNDNDYIKSYTGLIDREVTVSLLTGKIDDKVKLKVQEKIRQGEINLIIGTHTLIQKSIEYNNLGLAVIDEQHRFGVLQRTSLRQKGFNPHLLVMTATPIPRTLALTLCGDLDLSLLKELPPGRQIIQTRWLDNDQRDKAYSFIREQILRGRQAFIICPLIEESDNIEAKAAVTEYRRLSIEVFPDLKLGLLHGRMNPIEKDGVMDDFREGKYNILVSTPVVEVGIDIPNATVILIEAADRFGLSQLHQFRGRVGRGEYKSYCLLLAEKPTDIGKERLKAIEKINDGFELAEKDLELRGPGEFLGTRQSGLPDLYMAKLSDVGLIQLARKEAIEVFNTDPKLEKSKNSHLVKELSRIWTRKGEWS